MSNKPELSDDLYYDEELGEIQSNKPAWTITKTSSQDKWDQVEQWNSINRTKPKNSKFIIALWTVLASVWIYHNQQAKTHSEQISKTLEDKKEIKIDKLSKQEPNEIAKHMIPEHLWD